MKVRAAFLVAIMVALVGIVNVLQTEAQTRTLYTPGPLVQYRSTITTSTNATTTVNVQCGQVAAVCPAGTYVLRLYQGVTTASSAGSGQTNVGYNNGQGAVTVTAGAAAVNIATTGNSSGTVIIKADGVNNITYGFVTTGMSGTGVIVVDAILQRIR